MVVDFDDVKTITPSSVQLGGNLETEVEVLNAPAMDSLARAEIDVQIATAHRFPRSVKRFTDEAMAMATMDEETAASCFYKLPRGGKPIEGPGIRLAEIVGCAWGNMKYGARIVSENNEFIIAQGVAHDLEKNVSATIEVRRRITDKHGRRYKADMIAVTANAACSIGLRNAIFRVIPRSFVNNIYEEAKRVAIGDASTLVERREKALLYFAKMGVNTERILAMLEKKGVEDINLEDLETLTGLKTAIKEGDTTVDQAFPPLKDPEQFKGNANAFKKAPAEPEPEPEATVNTETGEVTEEAPEPEPEPNIGAPITKADYIAAIIEAQGRYAWTDPVFLGVLSTVTGKEIADPNKLTKAQAEQCYEVLSDTGKAVDAWNNYNASVNGGNLFDGKE